MVNDKLMEIRNHVIYALKNEYRKATRTANFLTEISPINSGTRRKNTIRFPRIWGEYLAA
jgi:hypothetical protein